MQRQFELLAPPPLMGTIGGTREVGWFGNSSLTDIAAITADSTDRHRFHRFFVERSGGTEIMKLAQLSEPVATKREACEMLLSKLRSASTG